MVNKTVSHWNKPYFSCLPLLMSTNHSWQVPFFKVFLTQLRLFFFGQKIKPAVSLSHTLWSYRGSITRAQNDVTKPCAPGQKGSVTVAGNQFTSMQRQACERTLLNARWCIFRCEKRHVYSSWTLHHRTHLFLESCFCNTEKRPGLAKDRMGWAKLPKGAPAPAPGHSSAAQEHQSPQVTKCTFFLHVLKHWPILCWAALLQR